MPPPTDLYKTLGLRKNATAASIKKAYRRLAAEHHPDRNPGDPSAEDRFRAVQLAYDVLADPERRARYDATGETDSPKVADPHTEIAELLSPLLTSLLRELMAQNRDVCEEDLVGCLRHTVARIKGSLAKDRADLTRAQRAFTKAAGRFTVEAGVENVLDAVVRGHLAKVEQQLVRVAAEIERHDRALTYLAKCSFARDDQAALNNILIRWTNIPGNSVGIY